MSALILLSLSLGLDAQAKRPAVPVAAKVPSIEEVVEAEGFTPTPSQSDIYKPGSVLVPNGRGGHDVVVERCVEAEPSIAIMSQSSIATTLSGGVSARLGVARGAASGSIEKRLSFVDPEQRTIPFAKLDPSDTCATDVQKAARFIDLSSAIVLYDVLVAIIKNSVCTKADASGGVIALGAAEAAAYSECVTESDGQVPLGFKAVPLSKVLVSVVAESVPPPAPPAAAAPAPTTPVPATPAPTSGGALLAQFNAPEPVSAPVPSPLGGAADIEWVDLGRFQISKTEVTVGQYGKCVEAGACTAPKDRSKDKYCNWGYADRDAHPVNCVDWRQARAFAKWAGGRLPTGDEWTYAATSGGQSWTYPWGDEAATCSRAVMNDGGSGCGQDRTWPVCSKPAGNSTQGVCDLAGNVWEWTASRVYRGGGWINVASPLHASNRLRGDPSSRTLGLGFRLAR